MFAHLIEHPGTVQYLFFSQHNTANNKKDAAKTMYISEKPAPHEQHSRVYCSSKTRQRGNKSTHERKQARDAFVLRGQRQENSQLPTVLCRCMDFFFMSLSYRRDYVCCHEESERRRRKVPGGGEANRRVSALSVCAQTPRCLLCMFTASLLCMCSSMRFLCGTPGFMPSRSM